MKAKDVLTLSATVAFITVFGLFVYWIYLNFDIVDEGIILPYTDHYIYQISIAGKLNFYVQPELRLSDDIITSVILLGVSYISMTFAVILFNKGNQSHDVIMFLSLISVGMFYLAADESFGIHESIGHNMQFLANIPGMSYPDDFVIVTYGVAFFIFLFYYRSVYMNKRRPLFYFGAAAVLFVGAAISDATEFPLEEVVEIAVGISVLLGTMSLGLSLLEEAEPPSSLQDRSAVFELVRRPGAEHLSPAE